MVNFNLVYLVWLLSEIILNILTRSSAKDLKQKDKGSMLTGWVMITVAIAAGITCAIYTSSFILPTLLMYYTGIAILVLGMVIRFTAIWQLGKMFTVDVTIRHNHRIKKDGLYSLLRHPSYTGMLLSFAGFGLSLNNYLSVVVVVVVVFASLLYRIGIEEKVLKEQFGEEYETYCKNTYRLIPFVY